MMFVNLAIGILSRIKISKKAMQKIVEEADTDGDGYISLKEVFYFIKERASAIKEKKV